MNKRIKKKREKEARKKIPHEAFLKMMENNRMKTGNQLFTLAEKLHKLREADWDAMFLNYPCTTVQDKMLNWYKNMYCCSQLALSKLLSMSNSKIILALLCSLSYDDIDELEISFSKFTNYVRSYY